MRENSNEYKLIDFIKFDTLYHAQYKKYESSKNATDEAFRGIYDLEQLMKSKENVPYDKKRGWILERLEAIKFNIIAAWRDEKFRAYVTDSEGRPHDPADIEIRKKNDNNYECLLRQIQAKAYKKPSDAARELKNPKYRGMQRITTKDNAEHVKELMKKRAEANGIYSNDYRDSYDNFSSDGISYGGISSGGTTEKTLEEVVSGKTQAKIEKDVIRSEVTGAILDEIIINGIEISVSNFMSVCNQEKNFEEAARDVIKGTIKSSAKGVLKTKVRTYGRKKQNPFFYNKSFYEPFSEGVVDVGYATYEWIKGEKSDQDFRDDMTFFAIKYSLGAVVKNAVTDCCLPIGIYMVFEQGCLACISLMNTYKESTEEYKRLKEMYRLQSEKLLKYQADVMSFFENIIKKDNDIYKKIVVFCDENDIDAEIKYITAINTNIGADKIYQNYDDFERAFKSKKGIEWI